MNYKSPYPWMGGKSTVMPAVWQRFGKVANFVDPFFGSNAALLSNPHWTPDTAMIETINDADGMVCNFWRAVAAAPDEVAHYADWPVNECDQHARHVWLVGQRESITARLEGDPDYYDAKAAGWWVWGMSIWIGSGWCSGEGPWQSVDGQLVHLGDAGRGVNRQRVHLGNAGQGVNRKRVHLGDAGQAGTGDAGLYAWMEALQERLRRVRVCCGDWSRVCGPTPTIKMGLTAVFLDPPYSFEAGRDNNLYAIDSGTVAHDVRRWAIENGDNPLLRIALCGYSDSEYSEHNMPQGWTKHFWKTRGGYGSQGDGRGRVNANRETIWFSPHCLPVNFQASLFDFSREHRSNLNDAE